MRNPYQRIIRNGELIQEGHIDTSKKLEQLLGGIDIKNKKIMDIGCNLGEMCRIMKDSGALPVGVDIRPDYIKDAKELNEDIPFFVRTAERIPGSYDIAIASAMFHYIKDHDAFFKQMSRIADTLVMDVWLDESDEGFFKTERGLYIPTEKTFRDIAGRFFRKIDFIGDSLSPDGSNRKIFHLLEPIREKPKAVLIYGKGGSGKTTMAREMTGYEHLQLDSIFIEWKVIRQSIQLSVEYFNELVRGNVFQEYLEFHKDYIERWLSARENMDVVIEGYDMTHEDYRIMVKELLNKWEIEEISL